MSLPIDEIVQILRDGGYVTDAQTLQKVAKDLTAAEREEKEAKASAGPAAKTRLTILLRSDDPKMQSTLNAGAWVAGVPDDDTTNTYMGAGLVDRLRKAVAEHNDTTPKRGRKKKRIETWNQAMTLLKSKTIKGSGSQLTIKQKGILAEIVVLPTENVNP